MMPKFFSVHANDLILKLLIKDPKKRLGRNGISDLMEHHFFSVSCSHDDDDDYDYGDSDIEDGNYGNDITQQQ